MGIFSALMFLTLAACVCARAKMKAITTHAVGLGNHGITAVCFIQPGTLEVKCWDNCREDRLYCGPDYPPPAGIAFKGITSGWYFTCGLTYADHTAVCWGSDFVVMGDEYKNISYSLIASGGMHSCALRVEPAGKVDCWGQNFIGEGTPPNVTMISLSSGNNFTCGLTQGNKVLCWGRSDIRGIPSDVVFEEIYAGREHVCGTVKGTKETRCWGVRPSNPECIPPKGYNFSIISIGTTHSCGLREDNQEVVCWGEIDTSLVIGIPFSTIASGSLFACGIRLDRVNEVLCWGDKVNSPPISTFRGNLHICTDQCESGEYQVHDKEIGLSQCPTGGFVCLDCPSCMSCGVPQNVSTCTSRSTFNNTGSTLLEAKHKKGRLPQIAGGVAGSILLILGTIAAVAWMKLSRQRRGAEWGSVANRIRHFSLHELQAASDNFADNMLLGKGGFGKVYKGVLRGDDGSMTGYVAIKKPNEEAAHSSLATELKCLSRLHHKYLVNLVGYCEEPKLLVFEYMANGSLSDLFFKRKMQFSWYSRIKMASQAARGLEYLHSLAHPSVIHRDVKLDNILLDESWDAHIADFGFSKLIPPATGATHLTNVTVVGTFGYMDPQYYTTKQLTTKSDVYSFGMVLLAMLTAKKVVEIAAEVSGIFDADFEPGRVQLDPREPPDDPQPLLKTLELAKQCLQPERNDRPTMTQVVVRLDSILHELTPRSFDNGLSISTSTPRV